MTCTGCRDCFNKRATKHVGPIKMECQVCGQGLTYQDFRKEVFRIFAMEFFTWMVLAMLVGGYLGFRLTH